MKLQQRRRHEERVIRWVPYSTWILSAASTKPLVTKKFTMRSLMSLVVMWRISGIGVGSWPKDLSRSIKIGDMPLAAARWLGRSILEERVGT
uniref:Uncharacterized protein n=1 Tax=Arundo donax TaxID=35708 RepID=A0A0A8XSC7_ARUDO